jgi:hypothetical protein
MAQLLVTQKNYSTAHAWIEEKILQYLINVEMWVTAEFLDLPLAPDDKAVTILNHWVRTYMPRRMRRKMHMELIETALTNNHSHENKGNSR